MSCLPSTHQAGCSPIRREGCLGAGGVMTAMFAVRRATVEPVRGKSAFVEAINLDGGEVTLPGCTVFRIRDGWFREDRSTSTDPPVLIPWVERAEGAQRAT